MGGAEAREAVLVDMGMGGSGSCRDRPPRVLLGVWEGDEAVEEEGEGGTLVLLSLEGFRSPQT